MEDAKFRIFMNGLMIGQVPILVISLGSFLSDTMNYKRGVFGIAIIFSLLYISSEIAYRINKK